MFTIEDLKQGRCAVINDGTLEELREVLRSAFPDDKSIVAGYIGYKYFSVMDETCWDCWNQINLPKQSVKDFITKELKRITTEEYLYATKVEESKEVCMTVEEIEKALNIKNLKIVK